MDIYSQLASVIKGIGGKANGAMIFPAEVKAVSGQTCSVQIGTLELTDVRLRAAVNSDQGKIIITPKIGSQVLVADLSDGLFRDLAVMAYSEPDKIEINANGFEVIINDGKITIKNNEHNLGDLLGELIDAICALTVTTSNGPSGTPINAVQFTALKTKLGELLG